MKKSFWRHFMLPRRHKRKPKPELVVYKPPKQPMTAPDQWKPPFAKPKDAPPLNVDKQDLVIVNEAKGFDLGQVTATVGVLLQAEVTPLFKLFINDCLERFSNLDWGGVSEREGRMNDRRVMTRTGTVYGVYTELSSGIQVWIATDLDQGVTRIRLSDER